jgi:hypothetical protein
MSMTNIAIPVALYFEPYPQDMLFTYRTSLTSLLGSVVVPNYRDCLLLSRTSPCSFVDSFSWPRPNKSVKFR